MEKTWGRAALQPLVPKRLFLQVFLLVKESDFSMRYSSSVQTALHFSLYFAERLSRSVIFFTRETGTIDCIF